MAIPEPHLEKLNAALGNLKLPTSDKPRIEQALKKYKIWIENLKSLTGTPDEIIKDSVDLLNTYKLYIDVELIFDSDNDFLYRQKGQLKLDNSIIEEFIPWIIRKDIIPELPDDLYHCCPR